MNKKIWYGILLGCCFILSSFYGNSAMAAEDTTTQPSYTQRQSTATISLKAEQESDAANASVSAGSSGKNHRLPTTGELTTLSLSFLGTLLLFFFWLLVKKQRKERSNEA
ncbi:LPXTG cell wall anchor domain-containing protein [Candidatus Enterococcus ferrettii]|uniref:Gram-positive cocci surface proteins LPxTG domain-containing protein n=1 Tax=Candidatus Enterococcus ferrettii TaxID=2815324 RepID=A0ABV0EML0_9ENTE|nr:LPXTG cell wall anchor domain-containing protein [Enterococcus sp. 665A]MBO1339678.1 LPXTG cell wall anchor domain-containing protein [Enterococcus sp. 665A]